MALIEEIFARIQVQGTPDIEKVERAILRFGYALRLTGRDIMRLGGVVRSFGVSMSRLGLQALRTEAIFTDTMEDMWFAVLDAMEAVGVLDLILNSLDALTAWIEAAPWVGFIVGLGLLIGTFAGFFAQIIVAVGALTLLAGAIITARQAKIGLISSLRLLYEYIVGTSDAYLKMAAAQSFLRLQTQELNKMFRLGMVDLTGVKTKLHGTVTALKEKYGLSEKDVAVMRKQIDSLTAVKRQTKGTTRATRALSGSLLDTSKSTLGFSSILTTLFIPDLRAAARAFRHPVATGEELIKRLRNITGGIKDIPFGILERLKGLFWHMSSAIIEAFKPETIAAVKPHIKALTSSMVEAIKSGEGVRGIFKKMGRGAKGLGKGMLGFGFGIMKLMSPIGLLVTLLGVVLTPILEALTPIFEIISDSMEPLVAFIEEGAEQFAELIQPGLETFFKAIVALLTWLAEEGSNLLPMISELIKWFGLLFTDPAAALDQLTDFIVNEFFPMIGDALTRLFLEVIPQLISEFATWIGPALQEGFWAFVDWLRNTLWPTLVTFFTTSISDLGTLIITNVLSGILDPLLGTFGLKTSDLATMWQGFWTQMNNFMRDPIGSIQAAVTDLTDRMTDTFKQTFRETGDIWAATWAALKEIPGVGLILNAIEGLWNSIDQILGGWPSKMLEWGKKLIEALIKGIKDAIAGVIETIKGLGKSIIDTVSGWFGPLAGIFCFRDIIPQAILEAERPATRAIGALFSTIHGEIERELRFRPTLAFGVEAALPRELGKLPTLEVPTLIGAGVIGREAVAVLEPAEMVTPRGEIGRTVNITIYDFITVDRPVIREEEDISILADKISSRQREIIRREAL